jgi:hypothetical protein
MRQWSGKSGLQGSNSGMSLLELMLAVGVMTVTLSYVFGSLVAVTTVGGVTEGRGVAAAELTSVLESMQGLSYDALIACQPPARTVLRGERVTLECFKADGTTTLTLPTTYTLLATPLPNPLQIRCTVSWQDDPGHNLSINATQRFYAN